MVTHPSSITVSTCGRLHFGFFDLSATSRRRFGSMGVAIDAFQTTVRLTVGAPNLALDPWTARQLALQQTALGIAQEIHVEVDAAIPRHSGLGSGTQMALALGAGLQYMTGQPVDVARLAKQAGRGGRSGIGVGTFLQGGLVVDGGRGEQTALPPILSQHAFPADWCFLLMMDNTQTGVHGQAEKSAFQQLLPRPEAETHALSHLLLMQGLPALLEHDFAGFAEAIGALQAYNAAYFSPAQGGLYASASVTRVIETLQRQGHTGLGQSSWGPTGFVLLPDRIHAEQLKQQLEAEFAASQLDFVIAGAKNQGAVFNIA